MPQLLPVVLKDGTAVNHTFGPVDRSNGVSQLVEILAVGQNQLQQYVIPKGNRVLAKRRVRIPVVRSVGGTLTVMGYNTVNIDYSAMDISTTAELADLAAYGKEASADAIFMAAIAARANYY